MTERFQRITRICNLDGYGLEFGPSYDPVCPKRDGYKVEIVDFMNADSLRVLNRERGYPSEMINRIEEVDYVWKEGSYTELTGKKNYYDWIIAAHVIEHTTDIISFLTDCTAMLKADGVLSLAVPDKRYCFDFFRPVSTIDKALDKHKQSEPTHTKGTIVGSQMMAAHLNGHIAWNELMFQTCKQIRLCENESLVRNQLCKGEIEYFDCHEWVFTPSSFRLLMRDLYSMGEIDLVEASFETTPEDTCEFYITLRYDESRPRNFDQEARQEILCAYIAELEDVYSRMEKIPQEVLNTLDRLTAQRDIALQERDKARAAYLSIANSHIWRMTQPMRSICDKLKAIKSNI